MTLSIPLQQTKQGLIARVMKKNRVAIFIFILLIGYLISSAADRSSTQSPKTITDMIAVTEGDSTIIYVVTGKTNGIYRRTLTAATATELARSKTAISLTDSFEPILTDKLIDEPVAIAYYQGKLYVCEEDQDLAAVYEIDIASPSPKKPATRLFGKPYLQKPKSIAISDNGVIAVGDDKLDKVVVFQTDPSYPNERKFKARSMDYDYSGNSPNPDLGFDEPNRINFFGEFLTVLDKQQKRLSIIGDKNPDRQNITENDLTKLLIQVKNNTTEVKDFIVYNGIYYISDGNAVTTLAPFTSYQKHAIYQVPLAGVGPGSARLAASRDFLFVEGAESIRGLPRLVPVSINFELAPEKPLEANLVEQRNALTSLYEHLAVNNILPQRTIVTTKNYGTDPELEELLRNQKVLFERPKPEWFQMRDTGYLEKLKQVICKINNESTPKLCNEKNRLTFPIPENTKINLPVLKIDVDLTLSEVPLGNRMVKDHIVDRVIKEQQPVTAEYLQRANSSRMRKLETEFTSENFIPAARASPNLRPGTLVVFKDGKEEIVGNWSNCDVDLSQSLKIDRFDLPRNLLSMNVDNILPRQDQDTTKDLELKKIGVSEVVADLRQLTAKSFEKELFENARQKSVSVGSTCSVNTGDLDVYLIDSVVEANKAGFVFLRNGKQRMFTQAEFDRSNLLGKLSDDSKYSVIVEDPFYVAYRLLKVDLQKKVTEWQSVTDVSEIRPEAKQNILNETNKTLLLPATRWRIGLFLNAQDLDKTRSLPQLHSAAGVRVLNEEIIKIANTSSDAQIMPCMANLPGIVFNNRRELLNIINEFPVPRKIGDVYVGVGESRESVHHDSSFFEDVWYRPDPANLKGPWQRVAPLPAPAATPALIKDFHSNSDHGDHVAGLIGSKDPELPGLIPGVKLFLIDTSPTSSATLENQIDNAVTANAKIFNFSFTISDDVTQFPNTAGLPTLRKKMLNDWKDILFIASAGNNGELLEGESRVPVSWSRDLPNVIGVGAIDRKGGRLNSQWACAPLRTPPNNLCFGSNYSKKHVQIYAPGHEIFSTVSGGYACATGTSQSAPLVTAAAAALEAQKVRGPALIKARLIYTTDWLSNYEKEIWGGSLNYKRAVMEPFENIVVLNGKENVKYRFEFKNRPALKIKQIADGGNINCESDEREPGNVFECPSKPIPFEDILRIQKVMREGQLVFRVTYLHTVGNKTQIKILNNVDFFDDPITCSEMEVWNDDLKTFAPADCQDLTKANLFDYTAAVPSGRLFSF